MEKDAHFVICINNQGYEASLEWMKIYQKIGDEEAEGDHLIRVIDESGEDYLYPDEFFTAIQLPETALDAKTVAP
ncbi:MAG: hypothetical protein GH143_03655 [Calditrichaeota bacterium]|nr:hypothetical protein [Calditrichota bacterium]